MKLQRAFTLVELLVVIAVIGILAALLLAAISGVKERARRTQCLNNIKQFNLGVISYAHDNRDRLPVAQNGLPNGAQNELSRDVGVYLDRYYVSRKCMFEPGAIARISPPYAFENLWDALIMNGYSYVQVGYVVTFVTSPSFVNVALGTNANTTIVPQPIQVGAVLLPAPNASERVLIAGQVYSSPAGSGDHITNTFAWEETYSLGFSSGPGISYTSPGTTRTGHMDAKRKLPTGDNLAFLDGSAHWRNFKLMRLRISADVPPPNPHEWGYWW